MLYVELESLLVHTPSSPRGPSGFHALLGILHHLEAQAARDPQHCNVGVPYRVDCRGLSSPPDKILLDLANPEGQSSFVSPSCRWPTPASASSSAAFPEAPA